MKKLILAIAVLALGMAMPAMAQNGHGVLVSWTLSTDDTAANCPVGACVYNIYRAAGACSPTATFAVIKSVQNGTTSDDDLTAAMGKEYCYYVTFAVNGIESVPSNEPDVTVRPYGATNANGKPH